MTLLEKYAGPDRYYHTFKHIGLMLDGLDSIFKPGDDKKYRQLQHAIIYHDIVYDAQAKDNEELSADLAAIALTPQFDQAWIDEVRRLIMITKTHQPDPDDYQGSVISDLDLAGLASHNYIKHSKQIRKEYAFATDEQWYFGRQAFLLLYLSRDRLFHTYHGHCRWEQPARDNMELELSYIEAKIAAL